MVLYAELVPIFYSVFYRGTMVDCIEIVSLLSAIHYAFDLKANEPSVSVANWRFCSVA
jgi:hypothetical protein